jgi:hypothetical protein
LVPQVVSLEFKRQRISSDVSSRHHIFATAALLLIALIAVGAFGEAVDSPRGEVATDAWLDDPRIASNNDIQFQSDSPPPADESNEVNLAPWNCQSSESDGKFVFLDQPRPDEIPKSLGVSLDSGGVMFNGHHPRSHFNGPVTFTDRDQGQFDQLYMGGVVATGDKEAGWYAIFRDDLVFGNDFFFTTAAGLDGDNRGNRPRWYTDDAKRYGWSLPQLCLDVGYYNLNIKFGHFYSPVGYESAPSASNFFVTHSYTFEYGEPTTQTGILVTDQVSDNLSTTTGIVGGWDTFDADTRAAAVGGVTYRIEDAGSVSFTLISGDDSTTNQPGIGPFAQRTMYSLVAISHFSDCLTYIFQHDLGIQHGAATLQGTDQAEWYGINQYLFYKIHECCMLGARFEWFRDDDGFNVTGSRPGNPLIGEFFAGNFYETSLGLNYTPWQSMTIRPEVRYDWFQPSSRTVGSQNPFDDNTSKHQILYGIDAVLHY